MHRFNCSKVRSLTEARQQCGAADDAGLAGDDAADARAGFLKKIGDRDGGKAFGLGGADDGTGEGMRGIGFQGRGGLEQLAAGFAVSGRGWSGAFLTIAIAVSRGAGTGDGLDEFHANHANLAGGEGAGLVEDQGAQRRERFEVASALEHDAPAGTGGDGRKNHHRRGDDQPAGRGDDQQRDGAVKSAGKNHSTLGVMRGHPRQAEGEPKEQACREAHGEYGNGVGGSDLVEEPFDGGFFLAGLQTRWMILARVVSLAGRITG